MTPLRNPRRRAAALSLALSWGLAAGWLSLGAAPAWAQRTGPGISSGSGAGTGTGSEAGSGLGTTGTGTESGSGLGTTGTGMQVPGARRLPASPFGTRVPRGDLGAGAAAGARQPNDILPPFEGGADAFGPELGPKELSEIYRKQADEARAIDQPGDRAMAFNKIASSAIFTNRLEDAHNALVQARQAVLLEPNALVRDQRIMGTLTQLSALAEAQVREGMSEDIGRGEGEDPDRPGSRRLNDRLRWLNLAESEWEHAAELCLHIDNANFRTQEMYEVVRSQAGGSQVIANQVLRSSYGTSTMVKQAGPLNEAADRDLVLAAAHARMIERPIWRDRALVEVAANAAVSNQFARGLDVARTIPQPEIRTDGILRVAEAQARRGQNKEATSAYSEAARAVSEIPQEDPRMILTGVLIDSLVSTGRFDDARACVVLFRNYSRRIVALGAIAQSQGSRGRADSARAWIAREAPPEYRPYLYRKVNEGVIAAVDKNRSTALTNPTR